MVDLSQFSLEGKVALVTGGSRGIGEATAITLAQAGADVAVSSRKLPDLERVAGEPVPIVPDLPHDVTGQRVTGASVSRGVII